MKKKKKMLILVFFVKISEVRMYANHLVDNWIAVGKSSKPEESNSKTSGEEIVAKHKASGNYKIEIKDDSNTSMPAKSNVKNGTSPESISGCSRWVLKVLKRELIQLRLKMNIIKKRGTDRNKRRQLKKNVLII